MSGRQGSVHRLVARLMKRLVTEHQVLQVRWRTRATVTRAYFRGECLRRFADIAAASWDSVTDSGARLLVRIPTLDKQVRRMLVRRRIRWTCAVSKPDR